MAARWWLKVKFEQAGLLATIDGVGNVIGRSPNPGPALLLGSHSDTQPRGGWLDGAMGVVYALEAARALAEDPSTAHLAVDIASWTDEEGTYLGMVGCKSFCGLLDEGAMEKARCDFFSIFTVLQLFCDCFATVSRLSWVYFDSSAGVMAEEVGVEPVVPVGVRKMMNVVLKTRNSALKTRNSVSKHEEFCIKNDEFCSTGSSTQSRAPGLLTSRISPHTWLSSRNMR